MGGAINSRGPSPIMDISILIGLALAAAAILLFVTLGRKRPGERQPPDVPAEPAKPSPKAEQPEAVHPAQPVAVSEPVLDAVTHGPAADGAEDHGPAAPAPESQPVIPAASVPLATNVSPVPPVVKRDLSGLRQGLTRSRASEGFFGRLKALFGGKGEISPEIVDGIEEVLLSSDVGVSTTSVLLERLRSDLSRGQLKDEAAVWEALRHEAKQMLLVGGSSPRLLLGNKPTVVLLVGVNGAGKTTTIGKLATQLKSQGVSCVLAAGDTFRAAAVQQLVVWGERVGCEVVKGKDGADPGSVVFDAIKRAQDLGADVVLADTAGRLHTKSNLMSEMQKIARTASKALEGAPHEVLLVIDSTNGQNALAQAKEFKDALPLSGIVLTKLDGTAKGGVVLGIADSLKLPVRFVGLGERPDDLHEFVADDFVEALLGREP